MALGESFWSGYRVFFQIENRVLSSILFFLPAWRPVTSGVPQGSVLGPLLFAIYVNDLPLIVSSNLFMFADNLKLYRSITQPLDTMLLQHDVNTLFHWTQTWLLNLSIPKCYVMSVGNINNTNPNYILHNVPLAASTCVRDLGVWIDDIHQSL